MAVKLYRIILPVSDIDEAAVFYTKLFEAEGERVSPGRHYFVFGKTVLACYDPVADGDDVGDGWRLHIDRTNHRFCKRQKPVQS